MNKYPLLQSQLGVMTYCIQYPSSTYYNLPTISELSCEIDINRLAKAWEKLFELRPVFRTRFEINENGEFLQYCDDNMEIPVIIRECNYDELSEYIEDKFIQAFDLFNGPLTRVEIIKTEKGSYLLWDIHHAIADYTMMNKVILQEELSKLYETMDLDKEIYTLEEAVYSELESFNLKEYDLSKEYYLSNFDKSSFSQIGNDTSSDLGKMIWGHSYIDIDECNEWCKIHNIKPNMLFQAAFSHVMSLITRNKDFAYWTTYHGRRDEKLMKTYGMHVKNIPVQNVNNDDIIVIDYIKECYNNLKKSLSHNIYPFTHLCQELNIKPKIIFNFVAKEDINYDVIIGKNKSQSIHIKRKESNNAINVQIGFRDNSYEIRLESSNDLVNENFLNLISTSIKNVIYNFMNNPNCLLTEIPMIPLNDNQFIQNIIDLGKGEEFILSSDDNIISAFRKSVLKYKNSVAVNFNSTSYTYGQIENMSNKVAIALLNKANIKKGDVVAIFIKRSEKMVTYPLGIMKTGAVYLPLDTNLPLKRIEQMCGDVKIMITDESSNINLFEGMFDVILTENDFDYKSEDICVDNCDTISRDNNYLDFDGSNISHNDGAIILYTSGSTGKPKGVKILHKGIINFTRWFQREIDLSPKDRLSAHASFGFDAHIIDIYSSLITGSSVFIIDEYVRTDINLLNQFLNENNINVGFFTTRLAHIINDLDNSLRFIFTGGEKIHPLEINKHQLINGYGPTECSIYSTYFKPRGNYDGGIIGRPLPNYQLFVVDENKNIVPPGIPGELLIGGYGVSYGYLNMPELNNECFIEYKPSPNSFSYRVFRSGDLVIWEDKNLIFIGRNDKQIKLRGYRIELDEIERVASHYYLIDEVVADVKEDTICLYYCSKIHIDNKNLKEYLSNILPNYMVPQYYKRIESIPYNINSKIDRDKLPAPLNKESYDYESTSGFFEEAISLGFSKVLNITTPISRNDEFSSLGGDSISVMKLVVFLRKMNIVVSVKDVLENQSVKNIALKAKYVSSNEEIQQNPYVGEIDKTPITRYFWDLNLENSSYFNQSFLLKTIDNIDRNILKKAMGSIVNHHDILRTYIKDGDMFIGEIDEYEYFTIETLDSLDYAKETERINREINLYEGPLIKLAIFQEDGMDKLYLVIHHLLVDGISWRLIIDDLNLAYAQLLKQEEVKLPLKTNSYQDYALAIKEYSKDEKLNKQISYWDDVLNRVKSGRHTDLSKDVKRNLRKINLNYTGHNPLFHLNNCSRYFNVSLNVIFISSILKTWYELFSEKNLSILIEGHGRDRFDENLNIYRTVGWFTNCYPLIFDLEDNLFSVGDVGLGSVCSDLESILDLYSLIKYVDSVINNTPNNGFDYPIIKGIETEYAPLFTFNYLGEMNSPENGLIFVPEYNSDLAPFIAPENNYGTDINLNGYSLDNKLYFELDYNAEVFSKEIVTEFGEKLLKNLEKLAYLYDDKIYDEDIHFFSKHPDKKNLFFIHSANYGSEFFYYFAEELKDDYTVSVIEPYNINHEDTLDSIEKLASNYINIIKKFQPEGPYYLGGLCFGGIIAYEITKQLEKQGHFVDKLILLDSHNIEDTNLKKAIIEDQLLHAREYLKEGMLYGDEKNIEDLISNSRLASKMWLDYTLDYYGGEVLYFRTTIKPEGIVYSAVNDMYDYVLSKSAGGFEDYLDEDKLRIIDVPVEHDDVIGVDALPYIIDEIKNFVGD